MSNIVPHPGQFAAPATQFDAKQMRLIRDTCAKDCNDNEFDLFITGYCIPMRLNPLRKQIYAFVFGKNAKDKSKRQMSVVIGIDGFRSMAARTGNYRPGPTTFEVDESLKDPLSNPEGLVSATVSVFMFSHGEWFEISETAWWSEQAPMKEGGDFVMEEVPGQFYDDGNPKKRKRFLGETRMVLDTNTQWPQRGRTMLAKCAEAKAIRRAWPDDFSNVYAEEEVAAARALQEDQILSPSEAVMQADIEARKERAGIAGTTILLDLMTGENASLQPIPVGQFYDRVDEFVEKHKNEPSQLRLFGERNRFGMREYWAIEPKACNALKKKIEDLINNPPAQTEDEVDEAQAKAMYHGDADPSEVQE